jgi:predicted amidohydrolase
MNESAWKIAAVQMDCRLADVPGNLASILARLENAAAQGARLVVFPECALTGYGFASKDAAWPHAQPIPGPAIATLAQACQRLNCWAAVGLLEREGDRLFNACALIGPQGQVHGYRKVHVPCMGVDRFATPGDRPFAVHDLGGLRVGLLICYDCSFPEASRVLALLGADLIVLPTNWPEGAVRTMKYVPHTRSLENNLYFAAVNRVGEEAGFRFIGHSKILDCNGDPLVASTGDVEEILVAEILPARARNKRIINSPGKYEVNRVGDRRPEFYGPLAG